MITSKKYLIGFLIIAFVSCNNKSNKQEVKVDITTNEGNNHNMEEKEILIFSEALKNNNYKAKSDSEFNQLNSNYLNLKGTEILDSGYSDIHIFNDLIDYQISKQGKYIKIGQDLMPDLDSLRESVLIKKEILPYIIDLSNLNKTLYSDDAISITNILSRNMDLGVDIVVLFNYEKSSILYSFVINKLKTLNDYPDYFKFSLLWYNSIDKPEMIRKKLILDLFNKNPEFIYNLTNFLFENKKKLDNVNQNQLDKTLAYLLDIQLKHHDNKDLSDNKGYELLNNFYVENDEFLRRFQNNHFFNHLIIEKYTKTYLSLASQQTSTAIIQDPDGFTNLRKEKSASSEILQKINTDTQVEVLDNTGDWWLVVTKEGKKGYVFKTKIKQE